MNKLLLGLHLGFAFIPLKSSNSFDDTFPTIPVFLSGSSAL